METPKLQMLLFRLAVLSSDLNENLTRLARHFHQTDETIVLSSAPYNIVDRKKEKERHKKAWKVELKEKIDSAIEYESLDEIWFYEQTRISQRVY